MSRPGTAAQEANYGFYVAPTYLVYASFLVNAGASIVDVTRKAIDLDGDGVLQVLGQLQTLFTKKGVTPPNDLVAADNGLDLFANGQLGLTITDPSTITARQSQAHFVWDVGVLPAEVPERKTTGTGAGYALLTSGKQQDAAWRLVTYLVSAQVQQREAPVGDWIPSRPAVATSATFLPEIDNVDLYPQHAKLFVDVLTEGRVVLQPLLSNWPAVRSALDAAIQGLWTGAQTPGETVAKMKQIAGPLVQQG
ncbi:MAG: extracellular solute-binding protein, partial [Chloroflexi bacterium]|nr:extracellular solute-binding protein [Chloroflexota bacterium]